MVRISVDVSDSVSVSVSVIFSVCARVPDGFLSVAACVSLCQRHFASHMLLYMLLVAFCYFVVVSIATGIILFVATAAAVEELSVWKTLARFELWVADSTVKVRFMVYSCQIEP